MNFKNIFLLDLFTIFITNSLFSFNINVSAQELRDNEFVQTPYYLVIDLDNDGSTKIKDGSRGMVYFNWEGKDFSHASDWIESNDAFLIYKDHSVALNAHNFVTKQDLLKKDENQDGKIDEQDENWNKFYLWRDKNSDGYNQSDELTSLQIENIEKIDINNLSVSLGESKYARIRVRSFQYNKHNSRFSGKVDFKFEALFLPEIRGYGSVPDLRIAISENDLLKEKVQKLCASSPQSLILKTNGNLLEEILFLWVGVINVPKDSRGPYIDGRKIAFFEKYLSTPFYSSLSSNNNPHKREVLALEQMWKEFSDSTYNKIIGQCLANKPLKKVKYNLAKDALEATPLSVQDLIEIAEGFRNIEKNGVPSSIKQAYWTSVYSLMQEIYGLKHAKQFREILNAEESTISPAQSLLLQQ